ncbi:aromatic ring-hydroxylating dioxygenase subunit alpha [uncultured Limnohabitans sp.]|uniref:aromatic ring-hydroxylating oxygenase subunit alpha n=1 Tax=uncultured Limnohabitans sp. TaxID=768543 RepID=UPI002633E184|nr:aromatic ring-hydroxylating dioxygenase subunit alpha [uncultured Limnohabitans sp.]
MFIKNTWYVACSLEELEALGVRPLGRTICNEPMVFFKGPQGKVAAVEDFCPHRGAPLSLGKVCEGKLVCGYHGLEMGCEGKTVHMPGQRVRGFPAIKSYAVVERYGFVWVWPGDQALADEAQMPSFEFFDNPAWAYGGGLYHVQADYRLMVDNLMDLTHETYVHATSIGQPEIDETPCTTTVQDDQVILQRHMNGIQAPPFWQMAMSANGLDPQAKVDRWQICRFTPPSHIMIDVGVALAGQGGFDAAPEHKAYSVVVDFITPETETSHWYHWGMARQFKPEDAALTDKIREGQGKIFNEDMAMLQLQQANISRWPDRKLLLLNIDSGGVQSRRIIDRLLAQEQAKAQAAPTPNDQTHGTPA